MANSLTDLVKSIDWGKVMSGSDARNALIGSALGGAILGGAGLAQERDPEESKLAPVGDALLGATLGGVAGYGIPKAVQLIRDSGALAPDNDKLKSNYLGYGLGGAAVGAGAFGVSLNKTLTRARHRLGRDARRTFDANAALKDIEVANATSADEVKKLMEERNMYDPPVVAEKVLAKHRIALHDAIRRRDKAAIKSIRMRLKYLSDLRHRAIRGYSGGLEGVVELLNNAAKERINPTNEPIGLLRSLLTGKLRGPGNFATHGAHYATKAPWWTLGRKVVGSGTRAIARGGKYALGGAALGMILHKILGPSASDNYKN